MAQLQTTAVTGSLTVTGQIVAQTLNVQQVTSSIVYSSGSNRFGNLTSDVQQFTGSLRVTGSGNHYIVGGNVGIGIDSPNSMLTVNKSYATYTPSEYIFQIRSGLNNSNPMFGVEYSSDAAIVSIGYVGLGSTVSRISINGGTGNGASSMAFYNQSTLGTFIGSNNSYFNNGSVGIGTSSPVQRLDVSGSIRVVSTGTYSDPSDNAGLINYDNASGVFTISARSSGGSTYIALRTSNAGTGAERVRITNDGNLGIGTTSPIGKLQIAGTSGNLLTVGTLTNNWAGEVAIGVTNGNGVIISKVNTSNDTNRVIVFSRDDTNGATIWGYKPGGTSTDVGYLFRANASSYFNGGDVGIGTTAPYAGTNVRSLDINATAYPTLALSVNGTFVGGVLGFSDRISLYAHTSRFLVLETNASEKMRIDVSGNVGIGTTSPGSKLTVIGDIATSTRVATDTINGYTGGSTPLTIQTGGAQNIIFGTNAVERARILTNGNVGINTTAPTARLQVSGSSDVLNVKGSGSLATSSLFSVDGAYGRLFEVSDDLSNSLFSVNTIAGLPVIEAFADYSVNLGTYSAASGSTMRVTGSRVGIGTTTPGTTLDVIGNIRAQSFTGSFSGSSAAPGTNTQVIFNSSGSLAASSGFVFTGASVGIGTASPVYRFEVSDGTRTGVFNPNSVLDAFFIGTKEAKPLLLGTTDTERVRINTSGNVGIGTTNPAYKLHVVGEIFASSNLFGNIVYTNTIRDQAGGIVSIQDDGGNVGIGTTTPTAQLHLSGTANIKTTNSSNTSGFEFGLLGGSADASGYVYQRAASSIIFGTSNTQRAILDVNGNIGIGATSPLARLHAGPNVSDTSTYAFTNTAAVLASLAVDQTAARTNVLALMRDGTSGVVYAGLAAFDMSRWSADSVNARTQLDIRLANTDTGTLTDVLSLRSNGNVGIGITASAATLHVSGTTGGVFEVGGANAVNALYVSASGNVGLGTTAPISRLQLGSSWTASPGGGNQVYLSSTGFANTAVIPELIVTSDNASTTPGGVIGLALHNNNVTAGAFSPLLVFSKRETGSSAYNASIAAIGARTVTGTGAGDAWIDGDLMFYTAPTAGAGLVERMRIIQDGNVGIGTSAPTSRLDVIQNGSNAAITVSGGTNPQMRVTNGTVTAKLQIIPASLIGYIGTETNHPFGILTNNTTRIHINADGNVGIGTTTPVSKLEVYSGSGDNYIYTTNATPATFNGLMVRYNSINYMGAIGNPSSGEFRIGGFSAGGYFTTIYSNNAETVRVTAGNVGIGTTNPSLAKLQVQGNIWALSITGSLQGTASYATQALSASYAPGGGGSQWTTNGTSIYYNTGNVGVGTTTPDAPLRIAGATNSTHSIFAGVDGRGLSIQTSLVAGTNDAGSILNARGVGSGTLILQTDGTERVRITSDGKVGIATTSPTTAKLVFGGTAGEEGLDLATADQYANLRVLRNSLSGIDKDMYIGYQSGVGSKLHLFSNNTETITVSGGSVGIGSTTPAAKLDVQGTISAGNNSATEGTIILQDQYSSGHLTNFGTNRSSGGPVIGYAVYPSAGTTNAFSSSTSIAIERAAFSFDSNGFRWYTGVSQTVSIGATATLSEKMTFSIGGNLGIGTTTPTAKLHISTSVNSGLRIESDENADANPTLYLEGNKNGSAPYLATLIELKSNLDVRGRGIIMTVSGSTPKWYAGVPYLGGGYQIGYDPSSNLPFTTANSAMFIDTSRNVIIGGTSAAGKLTIEAGGVNAAIFAISPGTDYTSGIRAAAANANGGYLIMAFVSGSQYGSLQAGDSTAFRNIALNPIAGSVGIGTTVPTRKLSVYDSAAYMSFNATGARTYTIGSDTTGFLIYDDTAGQYRVVVNASGNVGIGTTSPIINVHVSQSANTSVGFRAENPNTGVNAFSVLQLGSNIASNQFANLSYGSTGVAIDGAFYPTGSTLAHYGNGGLNFLAAGTVSPIRFYTGTGTGTIKMVVESGGNVGVGTTAPQGLFHVQGRTVISGSLNLSGSAVGLPEHMVVALSDETTNITTGTAKVTFRAPFAMRLTDLPRASLSTASTSGLVTVDINEAGTSVLGANKLSIDANELTSTTAATPTTIADALIADDAQITMDIDGAGTGARGLKVTLYYIRI